MDSLPRATCTQQKPSKPERPLQAALQSRVFDDTRRGAASHHSKLHALQVGRWQGKWWKILGGVQRFNISNKGLRMLRLYQSGCCCAVLSMLSFQDLERAIPPMLWHSGIMASAMADDCETEWWLSLRKYFATDLMFSKDLMLFMLWCLGFLQYTEWLWMTEQWQLPMATNAWLEEALDLLYALKFGNKVTCAKTAKISAIYHIWPMPMALMPCEGLSKTFSQSVFGLFCRSNFCKKNLEIACLINLHDWFFWFT